MVSIRNNKNNIKVVLIMGTTTLKSKVQKHEDSCKVTSFPDKMGHFGRFGRKFVPETIMPALDQLEKAYLEAKTILLLKLSLSII